MFYYEVSPISIIRDGIDSFTYSSLSQLKVGQVVRVSVGRKQIIGVIIEQVSQPAYDTKEVLSIIEPTPIPTQLVDSARWLSRYYRTPLATVWQSVLPRGIDKNRRTTYHPPEKHRRHSIKNVFTKDQASAIQQITEAPPGTTLLHGITGSGKTLVYIELAKKAVADNKSVILLVPEISLTSQLVAEFSQYLSNIIVVHSKQTEAERHLAWKLALDSTSPQIIIGPRSAIFMPLANIGLIVIDECHEPSFKQEQSPRYSTLRLASILAKAHKAKVVLGSATPSVSDFYLAKKSNHPIVSLTQPAKKDTVSPSIKLVDMTRRDNLTNHQFLSNELISALDKTFTEGNQALIFHNRRGTASTTLCQNCGWQAGCPRCFVPLTLHSDKHRLVCHICNFVSSVPTSCPVCHHVDIVHKGIGTKRIEAELSKLFPKQHIARFDGDTDSANTVEKRYQQLYDGDIDLIIGTQTIAKGLDLPKLRTIGVIQADAGLALPDFSSAERTFQLLAQVVGRVGRSHHPTEVIVQSFQPDHPAILDGISQNYQDFYDRTIARRRQTNFPPFCYLLKLVCVYKTEQTALKNSRKLAELLKQHAPSSVQILGPTPAFHERVRDTYRWQLVIKSPKRQDLVDLLDHLPKSNWQYELDPTSLL